MSIPPDFFAYLIIICLALVSFFLKKLTLPATITAIIVAVLVFLDSFYVGLEMLGAFFLLGVAATSWHKRDKEKFKSEADRGSRRDMWQVLANGGVAALCGWLGRHSPAHPGTEYEYDAWGVMLNLMMAGSLAAATADTLSSELGMVYGKRFFNILTLKPDQKGRDGVVSLEGTLIGIAGAAVIALIYVLNFGFGRYFWIITIAGTFGNLIDSILGATLERKHYISNNVVNFLNTLTGALIVLILRHLARHYH